MKHQLLKTSSPGLSAQWPDVFVGVVMAALKRMKADKSLRRAGSATAHVLN